MQNKSSAIMFLYSETSVHAGSGESLGAVDLAIQREKHTEFPMIASSGIKGAARDWFKTYNPTEKDKQIINKDSKIKLVFGPESDGSEHAGAVAFTDARILLFPVKSLKGVFAWITCPMVLERFKRDLGIVGKTDEIPSFLPSEGQVCGSSTNKNFIEGSDRKKSIILEEYCFEFTQCPEVNKLSSFLADKVFPEDAESDEYKFWREQLPNKLLIIDDDSFKDFVKHSTEIQTRVKLNSKKTTDGDGGNLFYQENLPCDCLMYSLVLANDAFGEKIEKNGNGGKWGSSSDNLSFVAELNQKRLQVGGNESIGKGIMCVNFWEGGNK